MRNPIGDARRASTVQCNQLTNAKIEQVIQETAAALKEVLQYVEFLAQGRVFPHAPLARNHMIESHHKIIANLEKDMEDLLAARAKRQLA
jgi:GMP synthase PP-ATPase subunit